MDKNAIRQYAMWARNELIAQVKQRAYHYGIDEDGQYEIDAVSVGGRVFTNEEQEQRRGFIAQIQRSGFEQAAEEVAYTWFNRFVALRYMEVNDYLPTHIRVLSDAQGEFKPDILKHAHSIELAGLNREKVAAFINASDTDGLYRYLLLVQCNALSELLPEMFEQMGAYTEMLLPQNILKPEGVVGRLVNDIPEEDFKDAVQIIGWLYQFYNKEPKANVYEKPPEQKILREEIPAATQLFTTDWIVRYMVENSLGRLWLESHPESTLKNNWKYYLDEAEQTPEVAEQLRVYRKEHAVKSPEDIKVIDPCMGSGHILVYAFDVLIQIYLSEGYSERDAAKLILEKNLYGLEIDRRAYQLSYFALMMKARQYNRRIFGEGIQPQVYEPTGYADGEEYGSLVQVDSLEAKPEPSKDSQGTIFDSYDADLNTWNFRRLLAQKYDVVITNPPYMGSKRMNSKLSGYVKACYPDSKSDLFAVFIERCGQMLKPTGYQAMITQHAWMFLPSYEKLRNKLLLKGIVNMVHLGTRAFEEIGGEVVQTTAFVMSSQITIGFLGTYFRLIDYNSPNEKERAFISGDHRYISNSEYFSMIPGSPITYWVKSKYLNLYEHPLIGSKYAAKEGVGTRKDDVFIRQTWEVSATSIGREKRWILTDKAGHYRRWHLGCTHVMDWENNGERIKNYRTADGRLRSRPQNTQYLFREGVSWGKVGSAKASFRFRSAGYGFNDAAPTLFGENLCPLLGFLNTKLSDELLKIRGGTLNVTCGVIEELPLLAEFFENERVEEIVKVNVALSCLDWNAFETSWDFSHHPLINGGKTIAAVFTKWSQEADERFNTLKANEEELNRIIIDIYDLQNELTPEVEDNDVTVQRADLGREIRSLISYAVGCMFGRYSLDVEGLAFAGGEWDTNKYKTIVPDKDNILPICDDEYFEDDIVGKFIDFLRAVYGEETLEENLCFIAAALGGKGTPREAIRKYFLNDFYKDHLMIYQKCPIYWLFDSGKKNGFKALMYMHRYNHDLLARMRTDYVHEQQERYRTQLAHIADTIQNASGSERVKLSKQQSKLTAQLEEITKYEERLHHLADQNIEFDLDDGVKKNYALFADIVARV